MLDFELDTLFDTAIAEAELESGLRPDMVAARHPAALVAPITFVVRPAKPPRWSEEEETFLRDNLGVLSLADIAACLGRSKNSVKVHFTRKHFAAPSKRPGWLTGQQAARAIGVDIHAVMTLADRGILPIRRLPGQRGIMAIRQVTLYRWAVNPAHWIYFKPQVDDPARLGDPHLRRLIIRQKERWGDAWLSPSQVAALHGVEHTDVNRLIRQGKIKGVKWGNWWVLRSEALKPGLIFYKGKGSTPTTPGGQDWSEVAEAFLVRCRLAGKTFTEIGRLMKIKPKKACGHFYYLQHKARFEECVI